MSEFVDKELEVYTRETWRWVEMAKQIAVDENFTPTEEAEDLLNSLQKPRIKNPSEARQAFWDLLSIPEGRVRALRWMDKTGLLEELLPCWYGNGSRRRMRLNALEQIFLEVWRKDVSKKSIKLIDETHDKVLDGRLKIGALTALATILAGGDTENQISWGKMVRRDLFNLGATENEIVHIENIVTNYRKFIIFMRGGEVEDLKITPQLATVCLSTMKVGGEDNAEEYRQACTLVNGALERLVD